MALMGRVEGQHHYVEMMTLLGYQHEMEWYQTLRIRAFDGRYRIRELRGRPAGSWHSLLG